MDPDAFPILLPLTASTAVEPLAWEAFGRFAYPGMVRIRTIPEPGALLHAALNAFFVPYRSHQFSNASEPVGRREMVNAYREYLSERLAEPSDPADVISSPVYHTLRRGMYHQYGDILKEYHIDVMQSELRDPSFFLDDKYLELISNELSKDIYVLSAIDRDVQYFPKTEIDMYYKGRPVIVLLYLPGHFELVGIRRANNDVVTHFAADSPFAEALAMRYKELHDAAIAADAAQEASYGV